MDNKGFTLIELMIVVAILGILAAIAIPNFIRMNMRAKEARVKSNCHVVQLAAEDFAVQNEGEYAADTDTDTTPVGDTVLDLITGAVPLPNPFTNTVDQPLSSGVATKPGEVGYEVFVGTEGLNDGYKITGHGRSNVVLTLTNGI